MYFLRRLFVGLGTGLFGSGLLFLLLQVSQRTSGSTIQGLGNNNSIWIAGIFLGLSYAALFQPQRRLTAENLMSGLVLGLTAWVVLALNLLPALAGFAPIWNVSNAATVLPQLIAFLLLGGAVGLIYGVLFEPLSDRLGLNPPQMTAADRVVRQRVLILGGGYAGVTAAQTLDKAFADDPSVAVALVSATNYLLHTPMLSEVSASAVNPQNISPPLRNFFRSVQVVQGSVADVDLAGKVVYLKPDARSPRRELPFDHLIVTAGGVPNFFGNKGVEENALTFKSLADSMMIRNQMIDMFERADFEADAVKRRQMLTFVVAGGGFAGVELIGGMNDFGRGMLAYYPHIRLDEPRFILIHSRDRILPELSAGLGKFAQEKMVERGVEFVLGTRVTGAESNAVLIGDTQIPTKTFVWTAGNRPSPILAQLGVPLNKRGQLPVNTELAAPNVPGLWAAGDCAQVPDLSSGKFCPPTAQHALREGKVAGYNVAATIKGQPLKTFKFKTLGSLAALGHQLAVAEIFGRRFSGFFAWLLWRSIYLSKLPTLEKRVRVGLDWLLDIFFPPDIVQTIDFSRKREQPPR